ncbi:MAG: hypothetical protein Q7V05_03345 [Methanoregula sp.]|nr:hypothetical protein [Methanoregula sp.]
MADNVPWFRRMPSHTKTRDDRPSREYGMRIRGELADVPGMAEPSIRISVTASAVIRKNCHVP